MHGLNRTRNFKTAYFKAGPNKKSFSATTKWRNLLVWTLDERALSSKRDWPSSEIKFSKTAANCTINFKTAYLKAGPNRQIYRHGKTSKAAGETSKRGGSKLEAQLQEINLPRAEKQQHRETTALLYSWRRNSCRWRSEDVSRQNYGRQKRSFIGKDKE